MMKKMRTKMSENEMLPRLKMVMLEYKVLPPSNKTNSGVRMIMMLMMYLLLFLLLLMMMMMMMMVMYS